MKLSTKDKEFLDRLKELVDDGELWIEIRGAPAYFLLRGNYGDRIETRFGLTRQGVRWRFWRLFNQIYVSAYETVLFVEKHLSSDYRQGALRIAEERYVLHHRTVQDLSFREANRYRGQDKD